MDRFLRVRRLLGDEAFGRLQASMVTVAGLGAVGGHAVEALARAGVGRIRVVDFDYIRDHNINRQILAVTSTVGKKKVEAARERIGEINPDCRLEVVDCFIDKATIPTILDPVPNLLVDAIDALLSKVDLLEYGWRHNIPVISSMGAALRTETARIHCGDLMASYGCPLAKRIRKKLRQRGVGEGIACVYSTEKVHFTFQDPENEPPEEGPAVVERGRKRNVLGSLPTVTGIFGLTIANMAIRKLAGLE